MKSESLFVKKVGSSINFVSWNEFQQGPSVSGLGPDSPITDRINERVDFLLARSLIVCCLLFCWCPLLYIYKYMFQYIIKASTKLTWVASDCIEERLEHGQCPPTPPTPPRAAQKEKKKEGEDSVSVASRRWRRRAGRRHRKPAPRHPTLEWRRLDAGQSPVRHNCCHQKEFFFAQVLLRRRANLIDEVHYWNVPSTQSSKPNRNEESTFDGMAFRVPFRRDVFLVELNGFIGFYWVLPGFTGFYLVLLWFVRVLWGFIRFYWVLPALTGF